MKSARLSDASLAPILDSTEVLARADGSGAAAFKERTGVSLGGIALGGLRWGRLV
jgi:hypothetical protein